MHDLIAIGDTVTDAFIKLKEAKVSYDEEEHRNILSMVFGEKIPYESVEVIRAVGNSANAAVSASKLGLKSALITNFGDDQNGRECLENLKNSNVGIDFISIHRGKESNYHYVLWYNDDRTILVKHQDYDRTWPEIGEPKWLYLSSLGGNTSNYYKQISEYLSSHPNVSLAFQPGTFQIELGKDALKDIYARTKIFFCNVKEAGDVLELDTLGVEELLKRIRGLGPDIVVITDGPKGAYAYDGGRILKVGIVPLKVIDSTGAGDTFSACFTSEFLKTNSIEMALSFATMCASLKVNYIGARFNKSFHQVESAYRKYKKYLKVTELR